MAFTTARKPYRIWLQFTHKDTGFGAISLTERSCAAPISKGDVTRDDSQRRFSAQHSVATLLRHCFEWLQHCSSIATMSCAKKPYQIWLLFTHKDTGFGAISLTERSCAAPISKGDVDLLTSRAFEREAGASRVLPHQTRKPSERLWESLEAMLHETISNDDFHRNTASQHCCHIVSNGYNIAPALQPCLALKIVVANRPV